MTQITLPSSKIGALIIFLIAPEAPSAIFLLSRTVACRAAAKLFSISGRLSWAVRAARAELLERGMKPTFFRASGTKKCRWRQRVETARMATSSFFTPRFLAIFSATVEREISIAPPSSVPRALAIRSISETRFRVVLILEEKYCCAEARRGLGPANSIHHVLFSD